MVRTLAFLYTSLAAFVRARHGGVIIAGGMWMIALVMIPGGMAMANYAWREAQWEELRSAARAAVAAAGPLLAGVGNPQTEAQIQARVAAVSGALLPNLRVSASDVDVTYDAATDVTTIGVEGVYRFDNIWQAGGGDETVNVSVRTRLEYERYEIAAALDVSQSMDETFAGSTDVKLRGLKDAMTNVLNTLATTTNTPGSMLMSVVPFSSLVNVADTCHADPFTGQCRAARSPGKERYVRMLAGAKPTMAATLADARVAKAAAEGGHWVDSFHQYGYGTSLGPLKRQFLPQDLLDDRDWDLRRKDVNIDVSSQIPNVSDWKVDDEDFWNGCVMARWGAYWDPAARPAGWQQTDQNNWPATKAVDGWSQASAALPAGTPLHLGDAPPNAGDPNTLFTAYSWPDARVSGSADHLLQHAMTEMLNPGGTWYYLPIVNFTSAADNDWSRSGSPGGALLCPTVPITPLSEDTTTLQEAVDALKTIEPYRYGSTLSVSGTYLNLGIVWGLRTLSPLWRGVWDVKDMQGTDRPGIPCAPGEQSSACDTGLTKSILIVSDGGNYPGNFIRTRAQSPSANWNADWGDYFCDLGNVSSVQDYHDAAVQQTESDFNERFKIPYATGDWIDTQGQLNAAGMDHFADAYLRSDRDAGNSARRADIVSTLGAMTPPPTPWQLFRGRDPDVVDAMVATGTGFGMDGRPALIDHRCKPSSIFGPYGRIDDLVYVGDTGSPIPVPDVAPFELASVPSSVVQPGSPWTGNFASLRDEITERLDDWFVESCRLAGERRVRVNAIYIGAQTAQANINLLEDCIDAAGGDPNEDEVFVTPTSADLSDAFAEIFTVRRNLRLLD